MLAIIIPPFPALCNSASPEFMGGKSLDNFLANLDLTESYFGFQLIVSCWL